MYAMLLLITLDLLAMGLGVSSRPVLVVAVIVGGAFLEVNNTLVTTAVMQASPVERPVASGAYSFVRFGGGAVAPFLAASWRNDLLPACRSTSGPPP
jgi:MFS transporter, ACDE family, multidrug resistance protein